MSDETNDEGTEEEEKSDEGGLGNLPPLSDFDSGGSKSEGNLPPLGDLSLDTPQPMETPASTPGGFSDLDTPASGLDTPDPSGGFGFQDLAADSDFSPETPDMGPGPGPESDIQTPMFDSAFGGDSGGFGSGGTDAPTQAMETPMFDASPSPAAGGDFGFDQGAFGAGGGGTPVPDFSPDTGAPGALGVTPTPPAIGGDTGGGRGGPSTMVVALIGIVALIIGLAGGPFAADKLGFMPNPQRIEADSQRERADDLQTKNSGLQRQINILRDATPDEAPISLEEIERRVQQSNELDARLAELMPAVQNLELQLRDIERDIEDKNLEFANAQTLLEEVLVETAITTARNEGLVAENARLEVAVGGLEDADRRRKASKDSLLHSVEEAINSISEGIPLTPLRYARMDRRTSAVALRDEIAEAKWVSPSLVNKVTAMWNQEYAIGQSREYFFAKIPVHDELGSKSMQWAECVMNGNWSVYWRTIDGLHVGSYENISGTDSKEYAFLERLPETVQAEIGDQVTAARSENFADQLLILQSKQAIYETKTQHQLIFESL